MSQNNINNDIKDERWFIKTFRPLLQQLKVQDMPPFPDLRIIYLSNNRDLIIKRLGRCIVVIKQRNFPQNIGGILITSYREDLDYFRLQIIINSALCNSNNLDLRIKQKETAVHEFTHAIATLSAIARISPDSKKLIDRLKDVLTKKAHALSFNEIEQIDAELSSSLYLMLNQIILKEEKTDSNDGAIKKFPDEHYRLGFEDVPISYPILYDELLFSQEMFNEYLTHDIIQPLCNAIYDKNSQVFIELFTHIALRITEEKALNLQFVAARILKFLWPIYIDYHSKMQGER